jgi:serine/threonine protein kinase
MLSPLKKLITKNPEYQKIPVIPLGNNEHSNLQKDFDSPVTGNDFFKLKDDPDKNLGFFDDVKTLLYKKNRKIYYVKGIEKKNIINSSYQKVLDDIYKINNDTIKNKNTNVFDFILNLQTHWEENDQIFLVFDGIQKYTLFENLLNNNSENITEENIIIIYRQILEAVNCLHENNIFGCNLFIDSFIYDKHAQTIKLTDLGFSKIFKCSKKLNDNKLENGYEFNDYCPPEFIIKMNDSLNIYDVDQLKNASYDVWQLGILFYKIATFGKSPYDEDKDENLKESIINKNINYSLLNKYSPAIVQIIDKMLQVPPSSRITIKHLLNLEPFKIMNKMPLLNIISYNNERPISMNMVNKEKERGKDVKIGLTSLLDNTEENVEKVENEEEMEKIINGEKKFINKNKEILNKVKIQGNLVKDINSMVSQEIYPDGSILPIFKNKFLNKFNNVDKNLVFDLSNKLALLEKEYKKLEENKLAVYNITNYINNNIKELNSIDNVNIELLIGKFNKLKISKLETNDLYKEMLKSKGEFMQDKFKALISNLVYEIKLLEIELEQEKSMNEKFQKKIKELEKRNSDLKTECQDKVDFYEKKIDLLEEIVFNTDKNGEQDLKKNYDYIYQALYNSIKDFTELNIKLKKNLDESLTNFREGKKFWLEEIIEAKTNFRNEMQHYLQRALERPKIYYLSKKDNKDRDNTDYFNKNKNNEAIIEELKREKTELLDLINEQTTLIKNNTALFNDLKKDMKMKDDKIEYLSRLLNNKESTGNK